MAASTAALRGITKQYKDFTLGPVDMTVPAGTVISTGPRVKSLYCFVMPRKAAVLAAIGQPSHKRRSVSATSS